MMDTKTLEIQHQVRQKAMEIQEQFKGMKNFEEEMKRKEKNMLDEAAKRLANETASIPIRSNKDFQKFEAEESTKKLKAMCLEEEKEVDKAERKKKADEFKEKGNAFVKAKDYEKAIEMYSKAIETHSNEAVYFSNRSQCYLSLEKFQECIKDTKTAIELDKCNSKAYYRQMLAYEKIGQQIKALQTCQYWMEAVPEDHLSKSNYDRIHNLMIEESIKKKRAKIKWSKFTTQTNFVEKKPHLQSKAPLKSIPVTSRKSQSPIPDKILDKIFNNNTGEFVPEPETNSKLFKPNFMEKSYIKPTPLKLEPLLDDKSKVNEKNEILKASENTNNKEKLPTLAELEELKNHLIVLPTTGPQFSAGWKELSEELKFLYLRNISSNSVDLGRLLGAQLDSDLLNEIIGVTHKFFIHFNINYIEMLYSLSKNSEMSILAMFLEEDDKKKLNELLSNALQGGDNNVNNTIQQIKQNFQL